MSAKNLEPVHHADHEITQRTRDHLISQRRVDALRSAVKTYTSDYELPEAYKPDFLRVVHAPGAIL